MAFIWYPPSHVVASVLVKMGVYLRILLTFGDRGDVDFVARDYQCISAIESTGTHPSRFKPSLQRPRPPPMRRVPPRHKRRLPQRSTSPLTNLNFAFSCFVA